MGIEGRVIFHSLRAELRHARTMVRRGHLTAATDHALRAIVTSQSSGQGIAFVARSLRRLSSGKTTAFTFDIADLHEALDHAMHYASIGFNNGMQTHILRARGISEQLGVMIPDSIYARIQDTYDKAPHQADTELIWLTVHPIPSKNHKLASQDRLY